ncbi:hypothetical protein L9F63_025906, partial [Diploptera punctata]
DLFHMQNLSKEHKDRKRFHRLILTLIRICSVWRTCARSTRATRFHRLILTLNLFHISVSGKWWIYLTIVL